MKRIFGTIIAILVVSMLFVKTNVFAANPLVEGSTKLESKTNDVKTIEVDAGDNKTKVLLDNGELWVLDSKTHKFSKKERGNVKKFITVNQGGFRDFVIGHSSITTIMTNDNKIIVRDQDSEIEIKNIKDTDGLGYLNKSGTYYRFTNKNGYIEIDKKNAIKNVTKIFENGFYIKGGKTYNIRKKEALFNFKITKIKSIIDDPIENYCDLLALTSNGTLYEVNSYYQFRNKSYKKIKNVKKIISPYAYKLKSGKIKYSCYTGGEKYIQSLYMFDSNLGYDKVLRENKTMVIDNVADLYREYKSVAIEGMSDGEFVVRTDGSIWYRERIDSFHVGKMVKVRSGKDKYKKLSKPSNVYASKESKKNKVSWDGVPGAKDYTVLRATKKDGKYEKIAKTKSASYTDKKIKKNKKYYYKIVANHKNSKYNSYRSSNVKAVKEKKEKIKLNVTSKKLRIGQRYSLKVKGTSQNVKWESSNESIATIDSTGCVTASKLGTTTVYARIGSKKYKCKINVNRLGYEDSIESRFEKTETGIVGFFTNKNKTTLNYEPKVTFYDKSGKKIATSSERIYCFDPDTTIAIHFESKEIYNDYKYEAKVTKSLVDKHAENNVKKIKYEIKDENEYVTAGEEYKIVEISSFNLPLQLYATVIELIMYDDNEKIIGCRKLEFTPYDGGLPDTTEDFLLPKDKEGNIIIPSKYKVFVNDVYMYDSF